MMPDAWEREVPDIPAGLAELLADNVADAIAGHIALVTLPYLPFIYRVVPTIINSVDKIKRTAKVSYQGDLVIARYSALAHPRIGEARLLYKLSDGTFYIKIRGKVLARRLYFALVSPDYPNNGTVYWADWPTEQQFAQEDPDPWDNVNLYGPVASLFASNGYRGYTWPENVDEPSLFRLSNVVVSLPDPPVSGVVGSYGLGQIHTDFDNIASGARIKYDVITLIVVPNIAWPDGTREQYLPKWLELITLVDAEITPVITLEPYFDWSLVQSGAGASLAQQAILFARRMLIANKIWPDLAQQKVTSIFAWITAYRVADSPVEIDVSGAPTGAAFLPWFEDQQFQIMRNPFVYELYWSGEETHSLTIPGVNGGSGTHLEATQQGALPPVAALGWDGQTLRLYVMTNFPDFADGIIQGLHVLWNGRDEPDWAHAAWFDFPAYLTDIVACSNDGLALVACHRNDTPPVDDSSEANDHVGERSNYHYSNDGGATWLAMPALPNSTEENLKRAQMVIVDEK